MFLRFPLATAACLITVIQAQKNLDIYLLIGQSNMSGRGPMIAADSTTDIAGAWLLKDTSGWEPARNPLNRYSTAEHGSHANQVGPGFGFATEMHRLSPGTGFGLVVNARGGSALAEWLKGTAYYRGALARTRYAMKSGTLKGILWHQGESDNGDTAYVTRLKGLIDSLRKDLGRPDLPFIAGQLGPWGTRYADFNSRIPKLAQRVTATRVVRSDSLTHKGDSTHFDRASQIKLGQRYAAAAWDLVYGNGNVNLRPPRSAAASAPFPAPAEAWDPLGRAASGPGQRRGQRVFQPRVTETIP
jgi:hypothetical protein